jgi:hypothetical protein
MMTIRAIGLLLCGGLLFLATTTGALAEYKKGQGPQGSRGNHCHCKDTSGGMDCLCGSPIMKKEPVDPKNGEVKQDKKEPIPVKK